MNWNQHQAVSVRHIEVSMPDELIVVLSHIEGYGFSALFHDKRHAAVYVRALEDAGFVCKVYEDHKEGGPSYYESDNWVPPIEAQNAHENNEDVPYL